MMRRLIPRIAASIPFIATPLVAGAAKSFADWVNGPVLKLGDQLVNLLYALCFIFFLIGLVRLFFSSNAENRQKGRMYAVYGFIGLVVLYVVWGLVHFMLGILTSFDT